MFIDNVNDNRELKKLADEWASDDPKEPAPQAPTQPEPINRFTDKRNFTREVFDYVKANPGQTGKLVAQALVAQGHNGSSVSATLTYLMQGHLIAKSEIGTYTAIKPEYVPVPTAVLEKARKERKRAKNKITAVVRQEMKKVKQAKAQGLAGLQIGEAVATPAAPVFVPPAPAVRPALATEQFTINTFDADKLLSTLSFTQTFELYKKLKAMLGEM